MWSCLCFSRVSSCWNHPLAFLQPLTLICHAFSISGLYTHLSSGAFTHTHTHTHTHTIASSFSFFRLQLKYHPLKRLSLRPTCKIIYFTCFFLLPIISITIMYNHTTYLHIFMCASHKNHSHYHLNYPPHPSPTMENLSSMKLIPGARKVEDTGLTTAGFVCFSFQLYHFWLYAFWNCY